MGPLERLGDILPRINRAHYLDGPPTDDELAGLVPDVVPPTMRDYVTGYSASGNILTIFVTDTVSRQELSLRAQEVCNLINAKLGRSAVARVKARMKH